MFNKYGAVGDATRCPEFDIVFGMPSFSMDSFDDISMSSTTAPDWTEKANALKCDYFEISNEALLTLCEDCTQDRLASDMIKHPLITVLVEHTLSRLDRNYVRAALHILTNIVSNCSDSIDALISNSAIIQKMAGLLEHESMVCVHVLLIPMCRPCIATKT